jgi:molybdenum cofactor cytidylyltransferase
MGRASKKERELRVSAIVLAAGQAARMGEQKLLFRLDARALVQWVVDAAVGAKVAETVVVLGYEAGAVREALGDRLVRAVVNSDYSLGMSTSLQAGVRALRADCDAAVFMLGDQPFVTSSLVNLLISRFVETNAWIVRPLVEGRPTHPVVISAALFPEILEQRGDVGGREIAARHPERRLFVPVDDRLVSLDIDTPADYESAVRAKNHLGVWGHLGQT